MTQSPGDPQFIITTQSGSEPYAANELARAGLHFAAWLEPGVGLFRALAPSVDAHAAPRRRPPVFVRHLFAVHVVCPLIDEPPTGVAPAARLRAAALALAPRLSPERAFSVQIRAAAHSPLASDKGAVARALVADLERHGYRQDARHPDDILSIYCAVDVSYLGVSPAGDNLSAWNGGMRRFAVRPEQISRAEFKLLEALEVFRRRSARLRERPRPGRRPRRLDPSPSRAGAPRRGRGSR